MPINVSINKNNIKQNVKIVVPKIDNYDYIFHYTSVEGLKNILQTKKLWFSGIQYLNDANEIKEGVKALKDYFDALDDGEYYLQYKPILYLILETLENSLLSNNIFVCSFSLGKDELPLWNYYTKDNNSQGYNICFSIEKILESIVKENTELLNGCFITYGNTIYYDKTNILEISKIFDGMFNSFADCFPDDAKRVLFKVEDIFKLSDAEKEYYNNNVNQVISEAKTIEKYLSNIYFYNGEKLCFEKGIFADPTLYIKNKAFESEKEIRIVIQIPDDKMKDIQDKIKFRTCNGILVPYLELEFGVESIDGFNLSPTLKDDIVERGLRKYLDCCGFDINKMEYGIQKSQIPLRY